MKCKMDIRWLCPIGFHRGSFFDVSFHRPTVLLLKTSNLIDTSLENSSPSHFLEEVQHKKKKKSKIFKTKFFFSLEKLKSNFFWYVIILNYARKFSAKRISSSQLSKQINVHLSLFWVGEKQPKNVSWNFREKSS